MPLKKWIPKKWKPDYDRIVAYRVMGKMNKEIADLLSYTPEHVSTILSMPQAIELEQKLHKKLQDNITTNVPDVLDEIAQLSAKRIKQVLSNDELFEKSPFAVIDRGIDLLKGTGHLRGGGNGAPGQGVTVVTDKAVLVQGSLADQLREGLVRSNEAKKLNAGAGTDQARIDPEQNRIKERVG